MNRVHHNWLAYAVLILQIGLLGSAKAADTDASVGSLFSSVEGFVIPDGKFVAATGAVGVALDKPITFGSRKLTSLPANILAESEEHYIVVMPDGSLRVTRTDAVEYHKAEPNHQLSRAARAYRSDSLRKLDSFRTRHRGNHLSVGGRDQLNLTNMWVYRW